MNELDEQPSETGFGQAAEYARLAESKEREAPEAIEAAMSRELNSDQFGEALKQFPDDLRERAVGWAVEYLTVAREADGGELSSYMDKMSQLLETPEAKNHLGFRDGQIELLIQAAAKELGVADLEQPEAKEQIFDHFRRNVVEDGFYYHGFNGAFEASIREHGLTPDVRQWDQAELGEVSEIGRRVGEPNILGWAQINSQGRLSLGDNTDNIYQYANLSPEWFAQFVASGFHIPNEPPYDKQAFAKRDYGAAKRNLELLCDRLDSRSQTEIEAGRAYPNISADERNVLMSLFEKYWEALAGAQSKPKLALVERRAIGREQPVLETYQDYVDRTREFGGEESLVRGVGMLIDDVNQHDVQISARVEPRYVHIVDLPDYSRVHAA